MARSRLTQNTINRLASALDIDVQHSADTHDVTGRVLGMQMAEGAPRAWSAQGNPRVPGQAVTQVRGPAAKALVAQKMEDSHGVEDRVSGTDRDEVSARSARRAPNASENRAAHYRKLPGGFEQSESYSSVKVAAERPQQPAAPTDKEKLAKLRALRAGGENIAKYRSLILAEPLVLDLPLDELPEVPFPPNDSQQIIIELQTIQDTMDMQPLLDDVMDLADDEPLELFRRACQQLGIPVDADILPLIVSDLRRYAMGLKYVYKRPRPFEVAPYYGMTIVPTAVDPYEGSPSYPSIHSTIGYGVANYYAHMYPQHADMFQEIADTIALQRVQSGHHFPSDNEYARIIANVLLRDDTQAPAPTPAAEPPAPDATAEQKVAHMTRGIKFLRR